MKFQDAVKKSIRNFMNGKMPSETSGMAEGEIFHTPEYFDEMEEDLLGDNKKKESADEDV
jgi:hypothetical protein